MSISTENTAVIYRTDPTRRPRRLGRYKGQHRAKAKRNFLYVSLATLLAAASVGCGVGVDSQDNPPLTDAPATKAVVAPKGKPPVDYGDGQYKVGSQIPVGTYTTTVPGDTICMWNRLKDFTGNLGTIKAQRVLSAGAKGQMTVVKGDYGVEFSGGCVWAKAATK